MAKTARIGSGPLQQQFKETVLHEVKKGEADRGEA
jgi:hypothetical protein